MSEQAVVLLGHGHHPMRAALDALVGPSATLGHAVGAASWARDPESTAMAARVVAVPQSAAPLQAAPTAATRLAPAWQAGHGRCAGDMARQQAEAAACQGLAANSRACVYSVSSLLRQRFLSKLFKRNICLWIKVLIRGSRLGIMECQDVGRWFSWVQTSLLGEEPPP
jgi:hypothetical protein